MSQLPVGTPLPVVREYDAEDRMFVCRISEGFSLAIRSEWPLLLGEAIHNMRSALDNAWWACAVKHLGREPEEDDARYIAFPVRKRGKNWDTNTWRRWVDPPIEVIAKGRQPPIDLAPESFHPLASLDRMWNLDKHRALPLIGAPYVDGHWHVPGPEKFTDCESEVRPSGNGADTGIGLLSAPAGRPGEVVERFFVKQTGPNPTLDQELPQLKVRFTTANGWALEEVLGQFDATVTEILTALGPAL